MQIQTNKYVQAGFWFCLGLAAFGYLSIHKIQFDTDFIRLFPSGDPDVEFYYGFKERFHSTVDDDVILIGLENPSGLFQLEFLRKTDSLTKLLSALPLVTKIYSLTNSGYLYLKDNQLEARPLIHVEQPESYREDSTLLFQSVEFRNLLVSKSGNAIAVAAFHVADLNFKQKQQILDSVQKYLLQLDLFKSHITGKIKFETEYKKIYRKYVVCYFACSVFLICVYFLIKVASLKTVLAALLVSSINWGIYFAVYSASGIPVSIFGVAPGVIAWCLSLGTLVFVREHIERSPFKDANREHEVNSYFKGYIKKLFQPFLILSLAFVLLAFTDVPALREISVISAIFLILTNLGTLMSIFFLWPYFTATKMRKVSAATHLFSFMFIFISTLFIDYLIPGGTLQSNIPKNSGLYQDYQFLENDFYGTQRFEMALKSTDTLKSFLDLEKLKIAEAIEKYLADSLMVAYIISPISLFKAANKAFYEGDPANYKLPLNQEDLYNYAINIRQTQYADEMDRYFSDGKMIRFSGRLRDMNKDEFNNLIRRFDNFFKSNQQYSGIQYRITGMNFIGDKFMNHYRTWTLIGMILLLLAGFYLPFLIIKKNFKVNKV